MITIASLSYTTKSNVVSVTKPINIGKIFVPTIILEKEKILTVPKNSREDENVDLDVFEKK